MRQVYTISKRSNPVAAFFAQRSVTLNLIIITVICFILEFIVLSINQENIKYIALIPSNILHGKYIWTLLLHIFAHGGPLHLAVNMFAFFSLGTLCERIIGRKRMLWFYLTAGLIAGITSVLLSGFFGYGPLERFFGSPDVDMVGASGAIFGIAGLFVVLLPRIRFSIIFLPFFSLPAYVMVPLILVATWAATIAANLPIGNTAHLGGFLVGIIYGYYLRKKYRKKVLLLDRYFG